MSRSPVGGPAMSNADLAEVCRFAGLPPYRVLELLTFIDRQLGYALTKREVLPEPPTDDRASK